MKTDYIDIVDKIVMKAFIEGLATPSEDVWSRYAVKARLELYGYREGQNYYLNELGIRYALNGYSKGIKERVKAQEELERLDFETKAFTKDKQRKLYWFSNISFWISILAFFGGFEALLDLLSWLLGLIESLCNS